MSSLPTSELAADPRVRRGMEAQFAERERRLAAGERPLGWKLGFGGPAAMAELGTAAPLIGFLTDRTTLAPGDSPAVGGWSMPLIEPEVAVRIGAEVAPGGTVDDAANAIDALGPAFELADLDPPPGELESMLAGDLYHRHFLLGGQAPVGGGRLPALSALVDVDGVEERIETPEALTGPIPLLVRHLADLLGELGERLRAEEIVICGSIVPPIAIAPGARIAYRLEPVGELVMRIR